MTPPSQRAVLAREPNAAADPVTRPARSFDGGPVWMRVVPPAVTLAAMPWGITGSSYWRDESATLAAVHRPFAQLVRMLGPVAAGDRESGVEGKSVDLGGRRIIK